MGPFSFCKLSKPSFHDGILQDNGLVPLRASRDQTDLDADLIGQELNIFLRLRRQLFKVRNSKRFGSPAVKCFVNRLDKPEIGGDSRERIDILSIPRVPDTNLDLVQGIKYVEFGQRDRIEAVQFS